MPPYLDQAGSGVVNIADAVGDYDALAKHQMTDSSGASLVGFIQSGTGAVATDLQTRGRYTILVTDFYADGVGTSSTKVDITGSVDSGAGINAAIAVLYALGGGVLEIPGGSILKSSVKIVSYRGIEIRGNNSVLNVSTVSATGPAIEINDNASTTISGNISVCMSGLKVVGHLTTESTYTIGSAASYTSGLNGINFKCPEVAINNCHFLGFDKDVTFGTHAYLIHFDNCFFRFSNYSIYFTQTGFTDLGENITFHKCIFGNNNHGIYNDRGEINIYRSSFDYHRYEFITENITLSGGQNIAYLRLFNCHLENTSTGNSDTNRIVNNGYLSIKDSTINDNYVGTWLTTATAGSYLELTGNSWQYVEMGTYALSVTSTVVVHRDSTYISGSTVLLLASELCNLKNNDAETGDLTGWTATHGTITADNTNAKNGTYAFKMVGEVSYSATLTSAKHQIPYGAKQVNLSLYADTTSTTATGNTYLYTYDSAGTTLDSILLGIGAASAGYAFVYTGWTNIDIRAFSYNVVIVTGTAGTGEIAYVDLVNVQFI